MIEKKGDEFCKNLMTKTNRNDEAPIHLAAQFSNVEAIDECLERGELSWGSFMKVYSQIYIKILEN